MKLNFHFLTAGRDGVNGGEPEEFDVQSRPRHRLG
jgi:hypothetical protein